MKAIIIHNNDNVAVAIEPLFKGDIIEVSGKNVTLKEAIPAGHKFAIKDIKKGEDIIKYAYPIGHAKCDIKIGEHIHTQNVKSNLGDLLEYTYTPNFKELEIKPTNIFL